MQLPPGGPFGAIGNQQVPVASEVIGPITGSAALTFTAQDGEQPQDEGVPAVQAHVGQRLGPQGQ
jgi:hypothetical protein